MLFTRKRASDDDESSLERGSSRGGGGAGALNRNASDGGLKGDGGGGSDASSPAAALEPASAPHRPADVARNLAAGVVSLFALSVVTSTFLKGPVVVLGRALVRRLGLRGLVGAVVVIDALPNPFSYAPMMLLAVEGGMARSTVLAACSGASVGAGLLGYCVGRGCGMPERLERWIGHRFPACLELMRRHGAWGVCVVGLLPVPFALGTWVAGAMGTRFLPVAAACLVRIPKTGLYLGLIASGLSLGGEDL